MHLKRSCFFSFFVCACKTWPGHHTVFTLCSALRGAKVVEVRPSSWSCLWVQLPSFPGGTGSEWWQEPEVLSQTLGLCLPILSRLQWMDSPSPGQSQRRWKCNQHTYPCSRAALNGVPDSGELISDKLQKTETKWTKQSSHYS